MWIGKMPERPKGLGIVAALQIVMGFAFSCIGLFSLIMAGSLYGFVLIGAGVVTFILGWELENLTLWAWMGTIVVFTLGLVGFILGGSWSDPLWNVLNIAPSLVIIVYLLLPGVRSRFLVGSKT
jgi:hypothetical protein